MNKEFTYSLGTKIAAYVFGIVFIAGGCYFFYQAAIADKNAVFYLGLGAITTLMAVYVPLNSLRKKITITDGSITLQGTFKTKSLDFKNAKGFREDKNAVIVDPADRSFPLIYISDCSYISDNRTMKSMIRHKLQNLDDKAYREDLNELLNDTEIGLDEAERLNKLSRAEKLASCLNKGGIAISLWLLIYPHPYNVILPLAIVYPLLIIFVFTKYKTIINIGNSNLKSAHPSLNSALLLPAAVLALTAFIQYDTIQFTDYLLPCIVIFLIVLTPFVLVLGWQELSERNKMNWLYAGTFVFLYSYGATICINCHYDYSVSEKTQVKVLDQHSSSGKHTTYYLTVSPWGARKKTEDLSVYRDLYNKVKKGDMVTIYTKKGLLHIPWFFVDE